MIAQNVLGIASQLQVASRQAEPSDDLTASALGRQLIGHSIIIELASPHNHRPQGPQWVRTTAHGLITHNP